MTSVDLGSGHGLITRALAPFFKIALGVDPSPGMIEQAELLRPGVDFPHVSFRTSTAEDLGFLEDGSLDLAVAGQAAPVCQLAVKATSTLILALLSILATAFCRVPQRRSFRSSYVTDSVFAILLNL